MYGYPLDKAMFFVPDWQEYMTLEEFKAEYADTKGIIFKFTGCGWYIINGDSLLILPGYVDEGDDRYKFYCWNDNTDVIESFKQIYNAPVQSRSI